ncbi:ribonuclease H-like domain-containing protein [Tanacetum coccineum]|uniref:Ribonuclease H-like domain-containing protein n=1 Tax=Tanacetum coccineum TaxID=301880 RepID=A0ABQ4WH06_9ASTR
MRVRELMKDQLLPADASPIALSSEDEEDKEEEEHLAPADPSAIPTDALYTISSCFLRPNPVQSDFPGAKEPPLEWMVQEQREVGAFIMSSHGARNLGSTRCFGSYLQGRISDSLVTEKVSLKGCGIRAFALRNFDLEVMEFESAHSNTTAKLPILKLAQENGTSVRKMSVPVTTKEKTNKKNDVKARSLLLMALPNEHQLTFSQYNDAKTMFAAIETRFRGSRRLLMNKAEIETMSIDDLYNNFKIVEQSVKKSVGASSGAQNLAFMTASSTSISTASFSDNVVYAFMVENPNGSNLLQQDLEQIHEDDLEAMDLKWQLSLLSMRAKRYFQRTGKKIFINANDTAGYDKSKVECFNYHKMGHFARECRAPRNKEGQFRNQDNTRKQGNNEDTSSKAMLAIDGVGFDWSDMAEEQVQTNMALMAFSDSEVYNDKTCSKTCLKNYETLNQTEFTAATYKRGLATVEEQLITYRKNEVLFSEEVAVLKGK